MYHNDCGEEAEFQLSTAIALLLLLGSVLRVSLQSGADPGTRKTMVASAGCLPMPLLRHHLARFSPRLFAINSSRIPPQHKPPSGAKSGLGALVYKLAAENTTSLLRNVLVCAGTKIFPSGPIGSQRFRRAGERL